MSGHDEYIFELIKNMDDARACAKLMAEEFVVHEPLAKFHQLSPQFYFDKLSWPGLNSAMDDGLSFLVRHRPSGEIVAAIAGWDLYKMHQKNPYSASRPPAPSPA